MSLRRCHHHSKVCYYVFVSLSSIESILIKMRCDISNRLYTGQSPLNRHSHPYPTPRSRRARITHQGPARRHVDGITITPLDALGWTFYQARCLVCYLQYKTPNRHIEFRVCQDRATRCHHHQIRHVARTYGGVPICRTDLIITLSYPGEVRVYSWFALLEKTHFVILFDKTILQGIHFFRYRNCLCKVPILRTWFDSSYRAICALMHVTRISHQCSRRTLPQLQAVDTINVGPYQVTQGRAQGLHLS